MNSSSGYNRERVGQPSAEDANGSFRPGPGSEVGTQVSGERSYAAEHASIPEHRRRITDDSKRSPGLTFGGVLRIGRHYVSTPFFALTVAEFALLMLGVYTGAHAWLLLTGLNAMGAESTSHDLLLTHAVGFATVMAVAIAALGLYQARLREGFSGVVVRLLAAFVLGSAALAMLYYLFPPLKLGRGALSASLLVSLGLILILRWVFLRVIDLDGLKRRVLILGAGERASSIMRALRRRTDRRGFRVVAYVDYPGWRRVPDIKDSEVVVLHPSWTLVDYAQQHGVQEIVVAPDERRQELPLDDLLDCRLEGIEIRDLADFFEREAGKVKLDLLSPSWMIFAEGFDSPFPGINFGRVFDLVTGTALFIVGAPFMLLTALAIWLEAGRRGSILYRQSRVGMDGREFELLKFRSMREDAEADGKARWAAKNDDRVTRVGRIIRATRIDELPQVFNVLRGEMRLVGPRPERPEFVKALTAKLPYYGERHLVRPGITGWAQLRYPYGSSDRDALEKLQYDLYYVKNRSLMLDLLILIQTVDVVLFGKGR
jgi:sugar transferase (PEP-CTERM system associated)